MSKAQRQRQAKSVVRAQLAAEQRRKRITIVVAVVAAVVVVGGLITWGVVSNINSGKVNTPSTATGDYGFEFGDGPVRVDVYLDYMCPACNQFETANGADIEAAVEAGTVTAVYHPVAILNRMSQGTQYSSRAGGAAACAAEEGKYLPYTNILYSNQPRENSTGLDDAKLVELGAQIGLGESFASCVEDRTYDDWVDAGTQQASEDGLSATPWVRINGEALENANAEFPKAFQAALLAAGGASGPSGEPSTGASS